METEIALMGMNHIFPAVTPSATPAFSIVSSAPKIAGVKLLKTRASVSMDSLVLLNFSMLTAQKKLATNGIDSVRGIPVAPDAKVIAARLVIQIVIKAAKLPVLKSHTCQTGAAWD
jgi:hypothetical protein